MIIAYGLLLCVAFCVFMIYRNQWVYDTRMRTLDKGLSEYRRLPSRDYMVLHFWVWDVNKFLKERE